ncbi:type II toxin-antitoxin system HipA family toxin [Curtobacterium luteum]|uniref:Toxin HipA n=1 Tax=Curtobacterium luteum TaxID=33881 RepID=A0A175RP19_9MICO|nr:HipA domain-containing protein [Curtobacterium luteum]KTR04539.1 hypothetical protein NS184_11900 [Curtobacterium luteum]
MRELRIDLYGVRVGTLAGERERFDFFAHEEGMRRFGVGATVLSVAVPLLRTTRRSRVGLHRRRAFFEEVLAEGGVRRTLAENARLDPDNTMGLLARYGRDTAGALQIWDENDPAEPRTAEARPVSAADVKTMFRAVKAAPLGNTGRRRVSSLAGMQDKVLLVRTADGWAEPLDGFPSTHILKPINPQTPSLVFDEEYGSRFVRALGLASFSTTIESFDGVNALVIERFDRDADGERVHQEDFNQALGNIGDRKYEDPGETDRLRAIAGVLRAGAAESDLHALLRMTALSVVLRNYDMHAKNIALLHPDVGDIALAPMYDVIPSAHLEVTPEFALAVNGRRRVEEVSLMDVVEEGRSWGVRKALDIVRSTAEQVVATARDERPHPGAHGGLDSAVETAGTTLLDRLTRDRGTAPEATTSRVGGRPYPQSPGGWGGPVP